MENKNVAMLVAAFVALIIGVSLIGIIASQGNAVTSKQHVGGELINVGSARIGLSGYGSINESVSNFTIANAPTGWKKLDCPAKFGTFGNGTINLTLGIDYEVFGSSGIIRILNTSTTNGSLSNNTYMTYTYCADDYLNSSFGRTGINLVAGFFAIALLLVAVGMFYQVLKNEGLTNM